MYPERNKGNRKFKKIMIVAGEASGDLHGSNLVKAMLSKDRSLNFYGIGGEKLRDAGVDIIADSSDMAVVGLTEVLSKLGFILKVRHRLKKSIQEEHPDLLILIDYPDFNISLAKVAKKSNVKVFYYISPQVWAWRKRRVNDLARCVDRMAVILPFEKEVYNSVLLDVDFVGHPLLDTVKRTRSRSEILGQLGLEADRKIVAILPGSREKEVTRLLPEMLGAAEILKERIPSVQFILPLAGTLPIEMITTIAENYSVDIKIVRNNDTYDAIGESDMAIVASGTATLEVALLEIPMIIVYKVSPFTYLVGRIVIDVEHIGLINIIAGKRVVPEIIQGDATAGKIAEETEKILSDRALADRIKSDLRNLRQRLGNPGAAERTAGLAYELLQG
ncbi:MAG: lipid-A-disaccharide synthase [Deltaproteobacteria bacterium]|nr:lipid-A-disaccharide synthase [Deltaproteobacteria bacterium]MBN2846047.1 lipid-A-disaccharide synthase [Deltaproteobacteria bacterium]